MKSAQDSIPNTMLGSKMATDNRGRVLRKPHFLTREEHVAIVDEHERAWSDILMAERAKYQELDRQYSLVLLSKTTSIEIVDPPKISARKRFHWILRWLIRVG